MTPSETRRRIWQLEARHEKFAAKIKKSISEARSKCEHQWTYHPDPSGNNDSGYSCDCGEWVKHKP